MVATSPHVATEAKFLQCIYLKLTIQSTKKKPFAAIFTFFSNIFFVYEGHTTTHKNETVSTHLICRLFSNDRVKFINVYHSCSRLFSTRATSSSYKTNFLRLKGITIKIKMMIFHWKLLFILQHKQ